MSLFNIITIKNITAVISIICFFIVLWYALDVITTRYALNDSRLLITRGIFSRTREEVELYRVNDYIVKVPFLYRLFSRGNIIVLSTDQSTPQVKIDCISNYYDVADIIRREVEKTRTNKGVRYIE